MTGPPLRRGLDERRPLLMKGENHQLSVMGRAAPLERSAPWDGAGSHVVTTAQLAASDWERKKRDVLWNRMKSGLGAVLSVCGILLFFWLGHVGGGSSAGHAARHGAGATPPGPAGGVPQGTGGPPGALPVRASLSLSLSLSLRSGLTRPALLC